MSDIQPFKWSEILQHWHLGGLPNLLLALALALYVVGVRRVSHWPLSRSLNFVGGLVITFLATQSVVGYYDMSLFGDHMVEHLLLIMVAAPLFAFAAPLELARQASPRLDALLSSPVARMLLHPLFGFGLYVAVIPLTHLTSFFNLMLTNEWVHHTEQIGFLVVGYLFFRQAVGLERDCVLHPGLGVLFVMAAVPVDTITGLALAMSSHNPFPAYDAMMRVWQGVTWGPSVLADIHLGGAIMWIGGDGLMLLWVGPLVARWVRYETRRTKEIDAELDELGL